MAVCTDVMTSSVIAVMVTSVVSSVGSSFIRCVRWASFVT